MVNVVWISWQDHRRTSGICDYLSIDLYVIRSTRKSIPRYLQLVHETIRVLMAQKPKVLLVQKQFMLYIVETTIIDY